VHVRIDRELAREKDAVTKLSEKPNRKLIRKKAEQLMSSSVAINFPSSTYGSNMPLTPEVYGGHSITEMEAATLNLHRDWRAAKKQAFPQPPPPPAPATAQPTTQVTDVKPDPTTTLPADVPKKEPEGPKEPEKAGEEEKKTLTHDEPTSVDPVKGDNHHGVSEPQNDEKSSHAAIHHADQEGEKQHEVKVDDDKEKTDKDKDKDKDGKDKDKETKDAPQNKPAATSADADKVAHEVVCDGCGTTVVGIRYHCMNVECPDYDLCETCKKAGGHDPSHLLVEIEKPDHSKNFKDDEPSAVDDDNTVVVGLRVYTSKECNVKIKGQLRHGGIVRSYLTMSKIL